MLVVQVLACVLWAVLLGGLAVSYVHRRRQLGLVKVGDLWEHRAAGLCEVLQAAERGTWIVHNSATDRCHYMHPGPRERGEWKLRMRDGVPLGDGRPPAIPRFYL